MDTAEILHISYNDSKQRCIYCKSFNIKKEDNYYRCNFCGYTYELKQNEKPNIKYPTKDVIEIGQIYGEYLKEAIDKNSKLIGCRSAIKSFVDTFTNPIRERFELCLKQGTDTDIYKVLQGMKISGINVFNIIDLFIAYDLFDKLESITNKYNKEVVK